MNFCSYKNTFTYQPYSDRVNGRDADTERGKVMRRPTQERGRQTREKILKTGMRLFSEKGYHGTNSKEIARESGIAIGSFYSYFKDKKTLFLELMGLYKERILHERDTNIRRVTESPGEKTRAVREMMTAVLRLSSEIHPLFHREVLVMRLRDQEVCAHYEEYRRQSIQSIGNLIRTSETLIPPSSVLAAAEILHNANEYLMVAIHSLPSLNQREVLVDEQVRMFMRYLWGTG